MVTKAQLKSRKTIARYARRRRERSKARYESPKIEVVTKIEPQKVQYVTPEGEKVGRPVTIAQPTETVQRQIGQASISQVKPQVQQPIQPTQAVREGEAKPVSQVYPIIAPGTDVQIGLQPVSPKQPPSLISTVPIVGGLHAGILASPTYQKVTGSRLFKLGVGAMSLQLASTMVFAPGLEMIQTKKKAVTFLSGIPSFKKVTEKVVMPFAETLTRGEQAWLEGSRKRTEHYRELYEESMRVPTGETPTEVLQRGATAFGAKGIELFGRAEPYGVKFARGMFFPREKEIKEKPVETAFDIGGAIALGGVTRAGFAFTGKTGVKYFPTMFEKYAKLTPLKQKVIKYVSGAALVSPWAIPTGMKFVKAKGPEEKLVVAEKAGRELFYFGLGMKAAGAFRPVKKWEYETAMYMDVFKGTQQQQAWFKDITALAKKIPKSARHTIMPRELQFADVAPGAKKPIGKKAGEALRKTLLKYKDELIITGSLPYKAREQVLDVDIFYKTGVVFKRKIPPISKEIAKEMRILTGQKWRAGKGEKVLFEGEKAIEFHPTKATKTFAREQFPYIERTKMTPEGFEVTAFHEQLLRKAEGVGRHVHRWKDVPAAESMFKDIAQPAMKGWAYDPVIFTPKGKPKIRYTRKKPLEKFEVMLEEVFPKAKRYVRVGPEARAPKQVSVKEWQRLLAEEKILTRVKPRQTRDKMVKKGKVEVVSEKYKRLQAKETVYKTLKPKGYKAYTPYKTYTPYKPYKPYKPYEKYTPPTKYTSYEPYTPYTPYTPYKPYRPYSPYTPYTPYTPYKPYTPPIVPLLIPGGPWLPSWGRKSPPVTKRRKFKYVPSITAFEFNIVGEPFRFGEGGYLSGLAIRPLKEKFNLPKFNMRGY